MTQDQFSKIQLEYKNKCTYLHNNLKEGESYLINGNPHTYQGYKATKNTIKAHIFTREGRSTPLILNRESLSILDIFDVIKIK